MILDFIVGASRTLRKPFGVFDTTAQLSVQLRALPLLPGATQRRRLRGPFSSYWQARSAVEVDLFAVKVISKLTAAPDGTSEIIVDDAGPNAGLGHADVVALPDTLPRFENDGLWFRMTVYPVATYLHPTAIQIGTFASVVCGLSIASANFISGLQFSGPKIFVAKIDARLNHHAAIIIGLLL